METMSLSSKDSVCLSSYTGGRYRQDTTNRWIRGATALRQAKLTEYPKSVPERRKVKRAFVGPKGKSAALEKSRSDGANKTQDKDELETLSRQVKGNRKETSDKTSGDFVSAVKETFNETNDVKTRGNDLETTKVAAEAIGHASATATAGRHNTKTFVQTVKNILILPIRLQQQMRRGKRKELKGTHSRERSFTDSKSFVKENMKEKTNIEVNEEENINTKENVTPLSAGKLQQLIRENVLSQSQTNSKRANKKTVLLADYVRTLQNHMGANTYMVPESNSPDFSETPFIAGGKKLGSEEEQGEEVQTAMQRRLEMLQQQIVRLPANFDEQLDSSQ